KTHWTEIHKRYLRELKLPFPAHRVILEELLGQVDQLVERIARLETRMELLYRDWQRKPVVDAVIALKRFQIIAAIVIVSEPTAREMDSPEAARRASEARQIGDFTRLSLLASGSAVWLRVKGSARAPGSRPSQAAHELPRPDPARIRLGGKQKQGGIAKCGN
ncbi:MAG TPA: hypothetical protein VMN03_02730, partial [Burkholderiales bacterium]|nr:hypothetical protein [Burkholderiales bacterium]